MIFCMTQMYDKIRDTGVIAIYSIPIVCAAVAINASIALLKLGDRIDGYLVQWQKKPVSPNARAGLDITHLF